MLRIYITNSRSRCVALRSCDQPMGRSKLLGTGPKKHRRHTQTCCGLPGRDYSSSCCLGIVLLHLCVFLLLQLMLQILHYLKDPKLWGMVYSLLWVMLRICIINPSIPIPNPKA